MLGGRCRPEWNPKARTKRTGFTWKPQEDRENVEEGNSINIWGELLCLVGKGLEGSKRANRTSLKGLLYHSGRRRWNLDLNT